MAAAIAPLPATAGPAAAVAVITRTRDRLGFLARAAESVARQTFRDFVWVVVNDGGDPAPLQAAIARAGLPASRIRRIDLAVSDGMESAGNAGVRACSSRYITLHDDDDSWEPDFLTRCIGVLDAPDGRALAGVVTQANHVSEELREGVVIEHARGVFNPDLVAVGITQMLAHNLFPPISLVVRRSVWERVGGYDARFPVLGDWYFNCRILFEGEIAVIAEPLANWHRRDRGAAAGGAAANSVIGAAELHRQTMTAVRNALMRDLGQVQGAAVERAVAALTGEARKGIRDGGVRVQTVVKSGGEATAGGLPPSAHTLTGLAIDLADRRLVLARLPVWRRMVLAARRRSMRGEPADSAPPLEPTWAELQPLLARMKLAPPPDFDEAMYLAAHPDIAAAVAAGRFPSGFAHYVQHGRREGRLRPLAIAALTSRGEGG